MKAFVVLEKEFQPQDGLVEFNSSRFCATIFHASLKNAVEELARDNYPDEFKIFSLEFTDPSEVLSAITYSIGNGLSRTRFHVKWLPLN